MSIAIRLRFTRARRNNTVTNVSAYNSYGTSPIAFFGSGTTGNLVQNSTFYNGHFSAVGWSGALWWRTADPPETLWIVA